MAPSSSDVEAQVLLETKEYDSYAWVLLDDHPLRAYPADTDCHPEVTAFARKCLIVQSLVQLPHIMSYFLEQVYTQDLPGFIQTPETIGRSPGLGLELDQSAICKYDAPLQTDGVTGDAVEYILASGCTGVKVDLWQRDRELLVGSSLLNLNDDHTLQSVYLQSLQTNLDARNPAYINSTKKHGAKAEIVPVGLFDEDSTQTFILLLDVQTTLQRAWPLLFGQLEALNKSGYLSFRNAEQDLILRPVTVVVSGRGCRRLSLIDDVSRAIKGSS
ncbi:hypothetical protein AN6281.2 [Aspergillus nidulans FGSC A4]|uniref:Uncharacterized protein n=1 Tax=Emericella nidulans (strain FGSC A4 / ATCC 38163 / CBS 112.46 / NRRL 194 / M139) TaxID=227321 RepID=Q5AZJ9_EMENI|nr:hypothetical protein [Aspergillus nidulans FGSC A4]EAA58665.1 hypothetical protein AN6281.2 [Aspergillus nidulans FGSC A4]CBF69791.1 TPA: conserved hypothetical protein [Aspergillus nidulans FGSC A4]|eukprot:XP_663885.1 hypothetical protein AN6281.2 [Aspergillus nidulans FGSC A4]